MIDREKRGRDDRHMDFYIGQYAEISKTIEESDIDRFTELSGDDNPLHIHNNFSTDKRFSKRICHGLLTASYISAVLGTKLPGPGTIYMRQTLSFLKPVYLGDTITASARIVSIDKEKGVLTLETKVVRGDEKVCVLEGEAVVKVIGLQE